MPKWQLRTIVLIKPYKQDLTVFSSSQFSNPYLKAATTLGPIVSINGPM